jgi:hypothetical protein
MRSMYSRSSISWSADPSVMSIPGMGALGIADGRQGALRFFLLLTLRQREAQTLLDQRVSVRLSAAACAWRV